jgi:general secretion pathway protein I
MYLQQQGFTLLEVMVALAIIAIALGATVRVVGNATSNASYLTDKSFAQWIAMNEIAKIKIANNPLSNGEKSGTSILLEREWTWRRKVKVTADKDVQRIEMSVFKHENDESSLVTVTAFMAKPFRPPAQAILQ